MDNPMEHGIQELANMVRCGYSDAVNRMQEVANVGNIIKREMEESRKALKKTEHILKQLPELSHQISLALGAPLPFRGMESLKDEDVPNIGLSDDEYMSALIKALSGRKGFDRLAALRRISEPLVSAITDNLRKHDKLVSRHKLEKGEAERKVAHTLLRNNENTIRVLAYRAKLCAQKFMETRRAIALKLLGETELFYRTIADVTIHDSIVKYPLGETFDAILKRDNNRK